MSKDTFETLRPKIDEAIRAGLSQNEFMELHDITRGVWYTIKPKTFSWRDIQKKLGVEVNKPGRQKKIKDKSTFELLMPEIDRAIKDGLTIKEFWERNNLTKGTWYSIKPKSFEWVKRQKQLGVSLKSGPKKVVKPKQTSLGSLYSEVMSELAIKISTEVKSNGYSEETGVYIEELNRLASFMKGLQC